MYTYLEFGDKIMYATGTGDCFWLTNAARMNANGYAMMYGDNFFSFRGQWGALWVHIGSK